MIKVRIPVYVYTAELIEKEEKMSLVKDGYKIPFEEMPLVTMTFYSINCVCHNKEENITEIHANGDIFNTNLSQEEV